MGDREGGEVYSAQLCPSVQSQSQDALGVNTIKQSEPLSSVRTSCRGIGGLEESNNEVVLMVSGATAKAKQVRDYGCSREGAGEVAAWSLVTDDECFRSAL